MDKLFLLDGMALIYRAYYALIRSPIYTSRGFNTSAIFGFTNTVLELVEKRGATHLATAFDTSAPTARHQEFPAYKAQREEMPEELSASIPYVKRLLEAFHIPVLTLDGYEADDIIGTLTLMAESVSSDTEIYMVTPDKDFAQLVSDRTKIFKPGRQGSDAEILDLEAICHNWQVESPSQIIDILGLWGDASDNIPGVPGIGEKTAKKLIAQFGSVETLLDSTDQLKGKQKENVINHKEQALLSKRLVTIDRAVPLQSLTVPREGRNLPLFDADGQLDLTPFALQSRDDERLKDLCVQFEFNTLGKRLFGKDFKEGRGHLKAIAPGEDPDAIPEVVELKKLEDVRHDYANATTAAQRDALFEALSEQKAFAFDMETSALDPRTAQAIGIAFSWEGGTGTYVPLPTDHHQRAAILEDFSPLFTNPAVEKIGHNLKFDLTILRWEGIRAAGPLFDTMLAHTVLEPDRKHTLDAISESLLGYTPVSISALIGEKSQKDGQLSMLDILDQKADDIAEYAAEDADITWQIAEKLRPLLKETEQERVFYEIEAPLLPVLVELEYQGFTVDLPALAEFSEILAVEMDRLAIQIEEGAGQPFNQNSPSQLGEILFDKLQLLDKPKKTKTGQYKTDEQTLRSLVGTHPIIEHILNYRKAAKLKSTYVDALPQSVLKRSGRVHTQFDQLMAATGRLASNNPNLQNIPIRTDMGKEIRKAFIPRGEDYRILAADYSQIELRVMAHLSGDPAMKEAFEKREDIHTSTAARVFHVPSEDVTPEMRSKAKMVNFGIIYGITGFGLSQRLAIPKSEANEIIAEYLKQYEGIKAYMDQTIAEAKEKGYAETLTGRRRHLRDINSRNWTSRGAAERTAINTPVQGTAADMIKLAMVRIQSALDQLECDSKMLLQVHDELVFDLHQSEEDQVVPLVVNGMREALPLEVPIVVDTGIGRNWLEAH